jgi:hypothetical protein
MATVKRYYVKIRGGAQRCLAETIYYRNNLSLDLLVKWMWFFKFREARYIVENPRHYCELSHGSYDYLPPAEEQRKMLRDKIINKKGRITLYTKKIALAENNWNELFPIGDYEPYQRAIAKFQRVKSELKLLEAEYSLIQL